MRLSLRKYRAETGVGRVGAQKKFSREVGEGQHRRPTEQRFQREESLFAVVGPTKHGVAFEPQQLNQRVRHIGEAPHKASVVIDQPKKPSQLRHAGRPRKIQHGANLFGVDTNAIS